MPGADFYLVYSHSAADVVNPLSDEQTTRDRDGFGAVGGR